MIEIRMDELSDTDIFERCLKEFYHNTDAPILEIESDRILDNVVYVTATDEYDLIYADFTMTANKGGEEEYILITGDEEETYLYNASNNKVYTF